MAQWPTWDEAKCKDDVVEIVVQINGKIRARLNIAADAEAADAIAQAKQQPAVQEAIDGKTVVKELYVKGKLVNIVVK